MVKPGEVAVPRDVGPFRVQRNARIWDVASAFALEPSDNGSPNGRLAHGLDGGRGLGRPCGRGSFARPAGAGASALRLPKDLGRMQKAPGEYEDQSRNTLAADIKAKGRKRLAANKKPRA